MAAITSADVLWQQKAGGLLSALLHLPDVSSADTVELATVGGLGFKKVICAAFFGQHQGTAVAGAVSANTTVTMTSASMAKDSVLLAVQGTT